MKRKPRYSAYDIARGKGRFYSGLAHFVLLIIALIGLPDFLVPEPPQEPIAISVELLPISEISNVKPQRQPPKKPEEKKEEKKVEPEEKKPSPPVKTSEPEKPEPEPEPVPEPKIEEKKPEPKKPEPKKEEKKKPEPKKEEPKKKEEDKKKDLAAILKAVRETAEKEREKEKDEPKPVKDEPKSLSQAISESYNDSMPMSMSERDMIMSQIAKCWNVPAGARNAQNLVVVINAEYATDGRNLRVEIAPENRGQYQSDSFFRAAADAAIRAVQRCSPLRNLPVAKYDTWHYMVLRFDPKYMLN